MVLWQAERHKTAKNEMSADYQKIFIFSSSELQLITYIMIGDFVNLFF